jgi:hypothetical protein
MMSSLGAWQWACGDKHKDIDDECRDEVLVMRLLERDLPQESALIALIDDVTARVLCSSSVPLCHLTPGQHFNLRLALPGTAALYVTLFLDRAPARELSRWRALDGAVEAVLQARLAQCSAPLLEGSMEGVFGVVACFAVEAVGEGHGTAPKESGASQEPTGAPEDEGTEGGESVQEGPVASKAERSSSPQASEPEASGSDASGPPKQSSTPQAPPPQCTSSGSPEGTPQQSPMMLADVYTTLSGSREQMLAALKALAKAQGLLQQSVLPIVGVRDPAAQLWPVMHGALHGVEQGRGGMLAVALHRVAMSGMGAFLGQCQLPLHALLAGETGVGRLTPFEDLAFEGGPSARCTALSCAQLWCSAVAKVFCALSPADPSQDVPWHMHGSGSASILGMVVQTFVQPTHVLGRHHVDFLVPESDTDVHPTCLTDEWKSTW